MIRTLVLAVAVVIVPSAAVISHSKAEVCTPGWAAAHRHVTTAQRVRIRLRDHATTGGEIDHRVPLELGGSNLDVNLRWQAPVDAILKDRAERRAHADVCAGRTTLADAQAAMWSWT